MDTLGSSQELTHVTDRLTVRLTVHFYFTRLVSASTINRTETMRTNSSEKYIQYTRNEKEIDLQQGKSTNG